MRIGVIGTGKMGRGFAEALAPTHDVVVGSRDPERARSVASKIGAAVGASYTDAVADADVVILTVPWSAWTTRSRSWATCGDRGGRRLLPLQPA